MTFVVRGKPQPITVLHAYGNSEVHSNGNHESMLASSHSAETPLRSSSLTSGSLGRLLAPRRYYFKDDMEIFSSLLEAQPNAHSFDQLWDGSKGSKKDFNYNSPTSFPSGSFSLSEEGCGHDSHPVFDWKSSTSKQDDIPSTFSKLTSTPAYILGDVSSSRTPPEAWGGNRLSDKLMHFRQSVNMPPRFTTLTSSSLSSGSILSGLQDIGLPTGKNTNPPTSRLILVNLCVHETSLGSSEHVSSSLGTKGIMAPGKLDSLSPSLSLPKRFSSYAERIGATTSFSDLSTGSPKTNKTGTEMREDILNSLLSRSNM